MGALVGLLFGFGVLTIWLSVTQSARVDSRPQPELIRRSWVVAIGCGLVGGVIGFIVTGLPVVFLLAGLMCGWIPNAIRARRDRRAAEVRRRAWPEVIDSLVSAVRAGMSLPEAVAALATRGPACLQAEFAAFAGDYRATGQFASSMQGLRTRLADPTADRIAEALLIAREVGGTDLGKMLRTLGDFVRQDIRLRDEAEARRSWTVNGARLAVAAPWLVLCLLSTQADVVDAYQTTTGVLILLGSAGACVFAYWLMTKIGELPSELRLVR